MSTEAEKVTAAAPTEDGPKDRSIRARRRLIGRVRSDKMDKTVVVEVVRFKMDPMYKKYIRVRTRYKAHDEKNQYKTGDRVEIAEHRPMSKEKRFKVVRLIDRPAQELS